MEAVLSELSPNARLGIGSCDGSEYGVMKLLSLL